MIAFLSTKDEGHNVTKSDICFIHLVSNSENDLRIEASHVACEFARKHDLKKVYLFYGKEKLIYEYSD